MMVQIWFDEFIVYLSRALNGPPDDEEGTLFTSQFPFRSAGTTQ